MDEITPNSIRNTDTMPSIGDGWILCRSKSHEGRPYYFNTVSGQAVWNLSSVEMEKAKRATKPLGHQPLPRTAKSPEPHQNPPLNFEQTLQNCLNNLILAQQVPNLPYSRFLSNAAAPQTIPNNLMNTPIIASTLNNVPVFNQHIWEVPLAHQIIAPTALVNTVHTDLAATHTDYNVEDNYDNFHLRENLQIENSFNRNKDNFSQKQTFDFRSRFAKSPAKINKFHGNLNQRQHAARKLKLNRNVKDLREKLSTSRKFNYNTTSPNISGPNIFRNITITNSTAPSNSDVDSDGIDLKEPSYDSQSSSISLGKNISPRKVYLGSKYSVTNNTSSNKNAPTTNIVQNKIALKLNKTVETGIQTESMRVLGTTANKLEEVENKGIIKECEPVNSEPNVDTVKNSTSNVEVKKRRIQLKRSLSSQSQTTPTPSKVQKTYKWRIKRKIPSQKEENDLDLYFVRANQTEPKLFNNLAKENIEDVKNVECEGSTKQTDDRVSLAPQVMSPSSEVSVPKLKPNENITIEETSTSGIISNSQSNYDAASESSRPIIKIQEISTVESPRKTVVYEVDSPSMHEYLKTKCDEWVSRFSQIMEEVLSQVLLQDPPFTHKGLPPPWTLHEATQCITYKFSNQSDIKEAADRLSNILFRISDHIGKIGSDMEPSTYMEMYGYGVALVESLKVVVKNSEDLHIATESLKVLLSDIQNPNLDCSVQESFNDISHEEITPTDITSVEDNYYTQLSTFTPEKISCKSSPKSGVSQKRRYNLRSNKTLSIEDNINTPTPIDTSTSIEVTSFFSSLELRKNKVIVEESHSANLNKSNDTLPEDRRNDDNTMNVDNGSNTEYAGEKGPIDHIISNESTYENNTAKKTNPDKLIAIKPTEHKHIDETGTSQDTGFATQTENSNETTTGPKIIRSFGRCIEFEKKLMQKYGDERKMQYMLNTDIEEDLDYEDDYQYNNEEYGFEDEFETIEERFHDNSEIVQSEIENSPSKPYLIVVDPNALNETILNEKTAETAVEKDLEPDLNNNGVKFKYVIETVLQEIKEAFGAAKVLWDEYKEQSMNPKRLNIKKNQLKAKAKKAHFHIVNISSALESMMAPKLGNPSDYIKTLMKKVGIGHIEDSLRNEYRNNIARHRSCAEFFLDCLQSIISD